MVPGPSKGFWRDKPVFVTGASGLVGGWLVSALANEGAAVTALVRDGSPSSHLRQARIEGNIKLVQGNFCDEQLLERSIAANSIHTIFHLGAQTVVGVATADPVSTLEVNTRGTWNLLDIARRKGVHQTLLASTLLVAATETNQKANSNPSVGSAVLQQPYAVSKICMERVALAYAHTYKMKIGILRFGNLYGGGDLHFSRLIPGAIRSAFQGIPFRFRTPGLSMRDFLYVEDAVTAYLRYAERLADSDSMTQKQIAFGLGEQHSLIDLVRLIFNLVGRSDLPPIAGTSSTPEISEELNDIQVAQTLLGWTPQFSLNQGMARTIDWFRPYFDKKLDLYAGSMAGFQNPIGA